VISRRSGERRAPARRGRGCGRALPHRGWATPNRTGSRVPRPSYLRRLRVQHLALYDANVNGWLDHQPGRRFLVRGLSAGEGRPGILRALLSDAFRIVDNLDVLLSALDGIQRAGAEVDIAQADLTDTRMYLKVRSTAIAEAGRRCWVATSARSPAPAGGQPAGVRRRST
jgi:hypothetical protein